MGFAHRRCRFVPTALAVTAIFAAPNPGAAADVAAEHSAGERCQADTLENWFCAADPRGSAVVDALGRVVCAPGACIKQDTRDHEGWLCSWTPGGKAAAAPAGPVCDGECRAPEATACKKL
jgi:hypothetical protein